MSEKIYLFFEDTAKIKRFNKLFMMLFYLGAIVNTTFYIISLIVPDSFLIIENDDFFVIAIVILCWLMAIVFTVLINTKALNYSIAITEEKILINIKNERQEYKANELLRYDTLKGFRFNQYKLIFKDDLSIIVYTRKSKELENALNKVLLINNSPNRHL